MSGDGRVPAALSVAGSDPSGGAGIQADLKTFAAHGVYGMAVLTALTAQNTREVRGIRAVEPDFVRLQLQAVIDDIPPDAVKVGMVATAGIAGAVADGLSRLPTRRGRARPCPVVVDPVMVSTSGAALLDPAAEAALLDRLVPLATLVTPNLPEAERLLRGESATRWTARTGVALLLKDGHGTAAEVRDRLVLPDGSQHIFTHPRVESDNTHGTGCTLSSAIAAHLARGLGLPAAVERSIAWLAEVIAASAGHGLGGGSGPLLHGAPVRARLGPATG